jgi:hypothetical protein
MPAPSLPHGRNVRFSRVEFSAGVAHLPCIRSDKCMSCVQWAPCHSVVAALFLIAFELLCIYEVLRQYICKCSQHRLALLAASLKGNRCKCQLRLENLSIPFSNIAEMTT